MEKNVDLESLASILDKTENGPVIDEKVWDKQLINAKVKELISKYEIKWDEDTLVPNDDALADRLFAAGLELALESGVYCLNTKRQMIWEPDELQGALNDAPAELQVGTGEDTVTIMHRKPEQAARVTIIGGAYGTLIEEELYGPMVEGYAKEPLLDIIEPPSIPTARGRTIRIQSPWD